MMRMISKQALLVWLLLLLNGSVAAKEASNGLDTTSFRPLHVMYSDHPENELLMHKAYNDPFWNAAKDIPVLFEEQQQQPTTASNTLRSLQDGPSPLNVAFTCQKFNERPHYDCSCRRSQSMDVFADCNYETRLCKHDNSSCYDQTFSVIMDAQASYGLNSLVYSRVTTCTKQLDLEAEALAASHAAQLQNDTEAAQEAQRQGRHILSHETCVEIQPTTPGRFNESFVCGASLNGRICKGCAQTTSCQDVPAGDAALTIDCCNVMADAKATCAVVGGGTGSILPVFDPAGSHKGCDGGAAGSKSLALAFVGTVVMGTVSLWTMLF